MRGSHKWAKNFYRAGLVTFLGAVAWLESDKLEMFVSLVVKIPIFIVNLYNKIGMSGLYTIIIHIPIDIPFKNCGR